MRFRQPRLHELLAAALVLAAASCGSTTTGGSGSTPVSLSETGSTLLYPLFSEWGPAYHQLDPNVTISTQDSGSGAGIAQVAAGAVDIGASDAYLSEGDMTEHPGL
ncbi:MAG: substrate-binding domain-containing protein, partial [Mycobacterium sp.]